MLEKFSLKDKVIIVTGATGVLGKVFVDAIIGAGGIAGILGRNAQIANERADEITKVGGQAFPLVADVLNEMQLFHARDKILHKYGRIDGLVNAAGGISGESTLMPGQNLFNMNMDAVKRELDVNLWGTVIPTQVFGSAMVESAGYGSIVNISSMNSKRAITGMLGYNLGKSGVDCFNQWYAVELANRYGDRIRMNAIAPGFFMTSQNKDLHLRPEGGYTERAEMVIKQTPFKRYGQPDELQGALIWLLSDASRFVTGAMICVDGGFSAFGGV